MLTPLIMENTMLENLINDALTHLPENPATMIHRIYQKAGDNVNADNDCIPDDVRNKVRDWLAMSAIDKLCNMKFVKTKLGTLNTGAYLVVTLLNELDAVKGELAKLEATSIINGGN